MTEIHTCSYSCQRIECIRAQRDELASRMTAETSNAREPDVAMALHWIDRYASGIDAECQLDRVAEALGVTLPEGYVATPPPPAAAEVRAPSYDALLLIAQSVCGALQRAGVTDCDDPGEAIDVLRERYEERIAALSQQPEARGVVDDLVHAARNAATVIRNCVNARQIGKGYAYHADDLDAAIAALTEARNVR